MSQATLNPSDEELARRSQAGSLDAFEELVRRYQGRVFRFLARCAQGEDDARELTQVTFVTAFRSLGLYRAECAFGPWLFVIARHKFIDHCRRRRFETRAEDVPEPSDGDDPATLLARREHRRDVWEWARRRLPPDQFTVLWLKYQEELSVREIARGMKRTETSVKVLLFRARQALLRQAGSLDGIPAAEPAPSAALARAANPRWEPAGEPAVISAEAK